MNTQVTSTLALVLVALLAAPTAVHAQATSTADVWRAFAEKVEPGRTLKVTLIEGQRFKATLLTLTEQGVTLQPRTRAPVPPQVVRFADIASLEIDRGKGANLGKAVAIGVAVAAGAFFGLLALTFAIVGD